MERLKSILFSYDNQDRLVYQLYAEFLRLLGIYVCEDIQYDLPYEKQNWNPSDFSLLYRIEKSEQWESADRGITERMVAFKERLSLFVQDQDFWECFDEVCEIYIDQELLQAATVLQYFKINAPQVLEAGTKFECAADRITELLQKKSVLNQNRYVRYAHLYCKQKANSSRYICEEPVVYYVDMLAEQCLKLIDDFCDFSNAWALLGLISEKSSFYFRETVDAYQKVLDEVSDKPYAASVYYWLGKCLEARENYVSPEAKRQYEQAYQSMKKYRNMYKMAIPYKDEENWEEANRYFLECIEFLDYKNGFLDPIEHEYYFKVNVLISFCYLRQEKYSQTIHHAKLALDLRNTLELGLHEKNREPSFYRKMYGERAGEYLSLALDRMNTKQIYRYLSAAYMKLGKPEEGEQYSEKLGCYRRA